VRSHRYWVLLTILVLWGFQTLAAFGDHSASKFPIDANCNFLPRIIADPKVHNPDNLHNPSEQFLLWEETANEPKYTQSTLAIPMHFKQIDRAFARVLRAGKTPAEIERVFFFKDKVLFPEHPLNTSRNITFSDIKPSLTINARLTSSRSVAVLHDGEIAYSVKIPTDHVTPNKLSAGKLDMGADIVCGIKRSQYIIDVDHSRVLPRNLIFLKESIGVVDPKTKSGMLVRDLSPLADGNYYLPAFSIPHVGNRIATLNSAEFESFWGKYYLESMGRAKAELLLRYGLELENPHAQNMLIQIGKNMKPTGVIVFRDISDTRMVESVAHAMGEDATLNSDRALNLPVTKTIQPFINGYSTAGFDISKDVLDRWNSQENSAYFSEIRRLLNLNDKFPLVQPGAGNDVLADYLSSKEGQQAVENYHSTLKLK
jgi:hypothetical protein